MPTPRYYTFWSINGPLDQARLREQMRAFQAAGLDGVVFHPRFYPGVPPYMSPAYLGEVSAAILYAKEIGLRFWLYDENGWPSGTADGQLLAKYPESAAVRLDLYDKPDPAAIGSFQTDASGQITSWHGLPARATPELKTWHMVPRIVEGIDTLNPAVCGHFLELIHDRYRTGLAPEAFDYVEAFFADEPESGAIKGPMPDKAGAPWSPRMAAALEKKFGPDYASQLPLVFARGEGYREFRIAYWELVTDLIGEGFFAPYLAWCRKYGKQFIGHVKGEEHPLFQLPMVGSCQRIYRQLSMPGIDSLERFPALDFYPRQASAVARQFGDGRCMVECFGGAGWGAAPHDLERYLLWLGRNGLTDFVFHLSQYRLDSAAIRDWPPSEPLHLTWREAFPEVLRRVKRELAARPPAVCDTLVVAPYRGLMAEYEPWELMQTNAHVATTYPDTPAGRINRAFLAKLEELKAAGVAYDVTDERTLEEDGRFEDGRVRLGQMSYAHFVVAHGAIIRGAAAGQALQLAEAEFKLSGRGHSESSADAAGGRVHSTKRDLEVASTFKLDWRLGEPLCNSWLLEFKAEEPGVFSGTFATAFGPGEAGAVALRFADDVQTATIDGLPLALENGGDGTCARLAASFAAGEHILRFRCTREKSLPYVWLEGRFAVLSRSPYEAGPNGTIRTAGPFVAAPQVIAPEAELVAAGLPFSALAVVAEAVVTLPEPVSALSFGGVTADALRASLDGRSLGWAWGPDWKLPPGQTIAAGEHRLRIELIPSTFNHFGPHHYYGGDWHVVSGDQMVGVKNFADPDDAPSPTHIAAWHFKPLRLPRSLIVN